MRFEITKKTKGIRKLIKYFEVRREKLLDEERRCQFEKGFQRNEKES